MLLNQLLTNELLACITLHQVTDGRDLFPFRIFTVVCVIHLCLDSKYDIISLSSELESVQCSNNQNVKYTKLIFENHNMMLYFLVLALSCEGRFD